MYRLGVPVVYSKINLIKSRTNLEFLQDVTRLLKNLSYGELVIKAKIFVFNL